MAKKLGGKPTGKNTTVGRPVYELNGERVSELSATIPFGDKFINVPSIHDGVRYTDDELVQMLKANKIEATGVFNSLKEAVEAAEKHSDTLLPKGETMSQESKQKDAFTEMEEMLAKGITQISTVKGKEGRQYKDLTSAATDILARLNAGEITVEQAERFLNKWRTPEYAEGGLLEEGGTIDPVSGNDVPVGSMQEEVRDDIPAQLSEGEFVFPADVVRYIGLENLMKLRQKAKKGLGTMEDMGQMGNSEEATESDDEGYNAEVDALIEEWNPQEGELEMAKGGVVYAQQGQYIPGAGASSSYRAPTVNDMIYGGGQGSTGAQSPVNYTSEQYIGPSGELTSVTLLNGKPLYPIPAGFKKYTPGMSTGAPKIEAPKAPEVNQGGNSQEDRERDAENKKQYDTYVSDMDVLSGLNKDIAKNWEDSPHNPKNAPKGFKESMAAVFGGAGGIYGNIANDIGTHSTVSKNIEDIARQLGINPEDHKGFWGGVDKTALQRAVVDKVRAGDINPLSEEKKKAQSKLKIEDYREGYGSEAGASMSVAEAQAQLEDDLDEIADGIDRDDVRSDSPTGDDKTTPFNTGGLASRKTKTKRKTKMKRSALASIK